MNQVFLVAATCFSTLFVLVITAIIADTIRRVKARKERISARELMHIILEVI